MSISPTAPTLPFRPSTNLQPSRAEQRELQKTLLTAAQTLAGFDSDGAKVQNNIGFNKFDTEFGHKLAGLPWDRWTPKTIRAARIMMAKYHGQLGFSTLDLPDVSDAEIEDFERQRNAQREMYVAAKQGIPKPAAANGELGEADGYYLLRFPYKPSPHIINRIKEVGAKWWKERSCWRIYNNPLQLRGVATCLESLGVLARPGLYEEMKGVTAHAGELLVASKADSTEFDVEGLGGQLKPFQRVGVKYGLEVRKFILADQMGLGKTPEAIALGHAARAYPAVAVVPASVLWKWVREVQHWVPGAMVSVLNGGRYWSSLNGDFLVTTYGQFGKWAGEMVVDNSVFQKNPKKPKMKFQPGPLCERKIRYLICDEAQYLKTGSALRTQIVQGFVENCKALEFIALLTGTPVLNRPKELVPLLKIIDRLKDFGGSSAFQKRYCGGHQEYGHWDANGASNLEELNQKLRMLCYVRREKKDVLKELPPKQRVTVPLQITNRQEYDEAEADIARWCAEESVKDEDFLASIRHLVLEEQKRIISMRKAETWFRARSAEQLRRIGVLRTLAARGKLKAMIEWHNDFLQSGEKLITFADHIEIQKAMLSELSKNWKMTHMAGGMEPKVREGNAQQFQNDPTTKGIVCSLMGAGVGWDGYAASDVAFCEFGWNDAVHDQAEDRAHRIGQTDSVTAWYLFGEGTIDQDSVELIEQKRAVVKAVTTGEKVEMGESIMHDLIKRLAEKGRKLL